MQGEGTWSQGAVCAGLVRGAALPGFLAAGQWRASTSNISPQPWSVARVAERRPSLTTAS